MQQKHLGDKAPRPTCPYCGGPLEGAVTAVANAGTVPHGSRVLGDVDPSPASPSRTVVLDQMASSDQALPAAGSHTMSNQSGTDAPEAASPNTPRPVAAPDDVAQDAIESIDDPGGEEDIGGYGHGV